MNSGMNILLLGPPGTGKTTSLKTLLEVPNLNIGCIFTEPRYDILGARFLDDPRVHWKYIAPSAAGWDVLKTLAQQVNTLSSESLQKLSPVRPREHLQYLEVVNQCNAFEDQRGENFGDTLDWGTDWALVIDGLTGLSKMARKLRVGAKVALTQPEWGASMQMIVEFLDTLTTTTTCHLIVLAHVERESDELTGGTKLMVSTLGRKIAPTLPTNFGDVILSTKETDKFYWDTADSRADLKAGFTPIQSKLPPSFRPLFDKWQAAGGKIQARKTTTEKDTPINV